ncbi:acetyl-CoA acetyltransferase [Geothrix rubra]|uniref:acetyl-CoA C-acyltransferase n=1 Tax=Geothrix rubra TaxID=2927977 RepID=A0ABQ5Q281_9BACT|nr:thiolase family protein [Geothrix rubra]GLH68526.1 acetyl-CoA acetyltransferase [Geothrix rubra]
MRSAVIVEAKRTPVGRGVKGAYAATRPEQLGSVVIEALKPLLKDWSILEDVLVGCAMPEGEQGMNMARLVSFRAGLPITAAAATINRFCGSSQETMLMAARAILANAGDVFLAGGVESMSKVPMMGFNPSVDPFLSENYPQAYCSMGITAENLAKEYKLTRKECDEFAFQSHQKAAAAWKAGKFEKEVVRFETKGLDGKAVTLQQDECVRADTSLEKLGELKPAFLAEGLTTAGNSSPITDGAAFLLVMEESVAKSLGLKPRARILNGAVAGVEPDRMGIGPVPAVKKVLGRVGLKLDQIDAIELNEAFAAQSLAVIREGEYDPAKVNAWGGAIAIGHPLGASGARILTTLLNRLETDGGKYGIATMCIGGGQGVASVIEKL